MTALLLAGCESGALQPSRDAATTDLSSDRGAPSADVPDPGSDSAADASADQTAPADAPAEIGVDDLDGGDVLDAATVDATVDAPNNDVADVGPMSGCGSERPDISSVNAARGVVIAADGTIYFSQFNAVGRRRPGMAPELRWVVFPSAVTSVLALALDATRHRLYAASTIGTIYSLDLDLDVPTTEVYATGVPSPAGMAVTPDGELYVVENYNNGSVFYVIRGRVYPMTNRLLFAAGLVIEPDGSLLVAVSSDGTLVRIHLADHHEVDRAVIATGLGNPSGLATDVAGRIYVSDNGGRRLLRVDADGRNLQVLLSGIPGPMDLAFGTGALPCTDLYIGSTLTFMRYERGDTPGAPVSGH